MTTRTRSFVLAVITVLAGLSSSHAADKLKVVATTPDFAAVARGAGINRVQAFETRDEWSASAADGLSGDEPSFLWLKVAGEKGKATPSAPRPMAEQIARLRSAI